MCFWLNLLIYVEVLLLIELYLIILLFCTFQCTRVAQTTRVLAVQPLSIIPTTIRPCSSSVVMAHVLTCHVLWLPPGTRLYSIVYNRISTSYECVDLDQMERTRCSVYIYKKIAKRQGSDTLCWSLFSCLCVFAIGITTKWYGFLLTIIIN
jgi:hypothetical protein